LAKNRQEHPSNDKFKSIEEMETVLVENAISNFNKEKMKLEMDGTGSCVIE